LGGTPDPFEAGFRNLATPPFLCQPQEVRFWQAGGTIFGSHHVRSRGSNGSQKDFGYIAMTNTQVLEGPKSIFGSHGLL